MVRGKNCNWRANITNTVAEMSEIRKNTSYSLSNLQTSSIFRHNLRIFE